MRRFISLAVPSVVVALAAAAVAIAEGGGATSTQAVTATFSAAPSSDVKTVSCTASDGTYALTHGMYTGTASGSTADLSGPVTIRAHAVINTSKDLGWVRGELRIGPTNGQGSFAHFDAVYASGKLAGVLSGHVRDPHDKLLANLSASFSQSAGFGSGAIGNTSGGAARGSHRGACERAKPPTPSEPKPLRQAAGSVAIVSSGSITVGDLTCAVGSSLAADVAKLTVGARAKILCAYLDGQYRLVKLQAKRS
jgi:hypothetical protein